MNHSNPNHPRFHAYLSCRDLGVGCDFEASAASPDEVIQRVADHAAQAHGMKGFGPALYTKLRGAVKVIDAPAEGPASDAPKRRSPAGPLMATVVVGIALASTLLLTAFAQSPEASSATAAPVTRHAPARASCYVPSDAP